MVVVGTVIEIETVPVNPSYHRSPGSVEHLVRLEVQDTFKDAHVSELSLRTPKHEEECGYPFVVGEAYLIYAFTVAKTGELRTGLCGANKRAKDAAADIEYLASLRRDPITRFDGVWQASRGRHITSVAGTITLTGEGKVSSLPTAVNGRFSVNGLPPGTYEVTAHTTDPSVPGVPAQTIKLFPGECTTLEILNDETFGSRERRP